MQLNRRQLLLASGAAVVGAEGAKADFTPNVTKVTPGYTQLPP